MTHRGKPAKTDAARKKTPSKARSHKNTVAKKKSAVTKKVPLTKKPSAKAGAPRKTTRQSNKRIGETAFSVPDYLGTITDLFRAAIGEEAILELKSRREVIEVCIQNLLLQAHRMDPISAAEQRGRLLQLAALMDAEVEELIDDATPTVLNHLTSGRTKP